MSELTFDVDTYSDCQKMGLYSVKDILRCLITKIKMISNKNQTGRILTNGNIACALANIMDLAYVPIEHIQGPIPYYFGDVLGVRLFIDPDMRWDDNRILFYDGEYVEEECVREYSELDPYGEENWNDNLINQEEFENVIFTFNIKDDNGVLI